MKQCRYVLLDLLCISSYLIVIFNRHIGFVPCERLILKSYIFRTLISTIRFAFCNRPIYFALCVSSQVYYFKINAMVDLHDFIYQKYLYSTTIQSPRVRRFFYALFRTSNFTILHDSPEKKKL